MIARYAVGGPIQVRDLGLLDSAVHRPRAAMFGQDAYPDVFTKAAALLHSHVANHSLVDGNTRLAWLATYVFCGKNDVTLRPSDDDAYDLVVAIAAGEISEVSVIAGRLKEFAEPPP